VIYFGATVPISWLQWSASSLLAIHHINSRNATIVGEETLSRIPPNFKVAYKFANSGFTGSSAAAAFYAWKRDAGENGFVDDTCSALKISANMTATEADGHEALRATNEAHYYVYPDALVGCARSDAATMISTIASLDKVPLMSFAATTSELTDKSRFPLFSRTNPGSSVNARAVVGLAEHFGWKSLNILAVDTNFGSSYVSDITSYAGKQGM